MRVRFEPYSGHFLPITENIALRLRRDCRYVKFVARPEVATFPIFAILSAVVAEFARPSGPRGHGSRTDVDNEIEACCGSNCSSCYRRAGGAKKLVCLRAPAGRIVGSSIRMMGPAPSWQAS